MHQALELTGSADILTKTRAYTFDLGRFYQSRYRHRATSLHRHFRCASDKTPIRRCLLRVATGLISRHVTHNRLLLSGCRIFRVTSSPHNFFYRPCRHESFPEDPVPAALALVFFTPVSSRASINRITPTHYPMQGKTFFLSFGLGWLSKKQKKKVNCDSKHTLS